MFAFTFEDKGFISACPNLLLQRSVQRYGSVCPLPPWQTTLILWKHKITNYKITKMEKELLLTGATEQLLCQHTGHRTEDTRHVVVLWSYIEVKRKRFVCHKHVLFSVFDLIICSSCIVILKHNISSLWNFLKNTSTKMHLCVDGMPQYC